MSLRQSGSIDRAVEELGQALNSYGASLTYFNLGGLQVSADREGAILVRQLLKFHRKVVWPISRLHVFGSPRLKDNLLPMFASLINCKSHIQGWKMIDSKKTRVVYFFDQDLSFDDEVNFIVTCKGAPYLTVYSDLIHLYGRKQVSVILASLLMLVDPYVHIHGSCALVGGLCLVFVGGKRAGKSSMIRELILADPGNNVVPLTDNITMVDSLGQVCLHSAPFSDELRLVDVVRTRELIRTLVKQANRGIDYYERSGKLRFSLSSIRQLLGHESLDFGSIDTLVLLHRDSSETAPVKVELGSRRIVGTDIGTVDRDWACLWAACPILASLVERQRDMSRRFYSREDLRFYDVFLPRLGGECEAAALLMEILREEDGRYEPKR